jgi:hypothetical protein
MGNRLLLLTGSGLLLFPTNPPPVLIGLLDPVELGFVLLEALKLPPIAELVLLVLLLVVLLAGLLKTGFDPPVLLAPAEVEPELFPF